MDTILEHILWKVEYSEHAKWRRKVALILKSSPVAINLLKSGSRDGRKKKHTKPSPTKTQRAVFLKLHGVIKSTVVHTGKDNMVGHSKRTHERT